MKAFWASLAQFAALTLLLWQAECLKSPSTPGGVPVEEAEDELPVFDLTVPVIEAPPQNYRPKKFFYPDTLLGTLMRGYCNKDPDVGAQFACNPDSKTCKCYSGKQVAPDSILWQDQKKVAFKHTLIGVPYELRSQLMKYNMLSLRSLGRVPNMNYPQFALETDGGTPVSEDTVRKTVQDYKSTAMRGQSKTKIGDVLKAYMHDPVCTLRSSVYFLHGAPPTSSHGGAKPYDLLNQRMHDMESAAKAHGKSGSPGASALGGQGPTAPSLLDLIPRYELPRQLRKRRRYIGVNNGQTRILDDRFYVKLMGDDDVSDVGSTVTDPNKDTTKTALYKRYATGADEFTPAEELGLGRRVKPSTVTPDNRPDAKYDRIDRCYFHDVLKERHDIDLGIEGCVSQVSSRCNHTPDGLLCHPFVQTRFYAPLRKQFYLDIEHFSFSAAFGVYLGPEKVLCGSPASIKNGVHYMYNPETSGLPILEEFTVDDQRFFKVGPFQAVEKSGKYKICACVSSHGEDDVKTCLQFSEYTSVLGQVIFSTSSLTLVSSNVAVGSNGEADLRNKIGLLVDAESNFEDCASLFDAYKVDWTVPSVKKLPSYNRYMRVIRSDGTESTAIHFPKPGKYRLCLINNNTGEVVEHYKSFIMEGIRDDASAVIYRDSSGRLAGSSLIFERYGQEPSERGFFYLADSETDCAAKVVGRWSGAMHPYYTSNSNKSSARWVVRDLQVDLGESTPRPNYAICVKYRRNSKALRIGSARVQNHVDVDERFLIDTPYHVKNIPDDIYNYQLGRDSEFVFTLLTALSFKNKPKYKEFSEAFKGNGKYYHGILGNSRSLMLHCRVYTKNDLITLWLMSDEDPTLYPLFTVVYARPRSVVVGQTGGKLYIYVLTDTTLAKHLLTDLYQPHKTRKTLAELTHGGSILHMDVIQLPKQTMLVAVDAKYSRLLIYDEELTQRTEFLGASTGHILTPGKVSCVKDTNEQGWTSCFIATAIPNELLHLSICKDTYAIKILSRYKSGMSVDDLDPKMGSIASLFATIYEHDKKKDLVIFALREDGEHGGLYKTASDSSVISFVSPLTNVGHGAFMRGIYPVFNDETNRSAMVLCEIYPKDVIDSSVELEKVFERTGDYDSSRFRLTWAPYTEIVHVPELSYKVDPQMTIGTSYHFTPLIGPIPDRFPLAIQWLLDPKQNVDKAIFEEVAKISDRGALTIMSKRPFNGRFDVVRRILWSTSTATIEVDFLCPDGTYYDGTACKECPLGTYNALKLVQEDRTLISRCKSCPRFETTATVGALSADECKCIHGYAVSDLSSGGSRCKPCSGTSYKSIFGDEQCLPTCGKNMFSRTAANASQVDVFCRCYPGYYLNRSRNSAGGCLPCEKGYYCVGGYKAKQKKCPIYTTTTITAAKSLSDCVCMAGYEPANTSRLSVEGTYENKLYKLISSKYHTTGNDIMVCVPCGYTKYKETPGPHACTACPGRTHAASTTNTNQDQCNRCPPGYYETNDPSYPCEVCSPNHICVGSDPMDPALMLYSGKRIKCDKNSVTLVPFEENVHLASCLCDKGYMARTRTGIVKCEAVPKNTYKDVVGNVGPTNCPPGSYTLKIGATDVSECVCKRGMFFDKDNKQCTVCPVGMYCLGGRLPNGEHMLPMMCTDGNAVTKDGGATSPGECLCKPGFYLRQDGRGGCVECPENTYKSFISNESCSQCPKNSMTYGQVGATSKDQCICAPGYYYHNGTCKVCGHSKKYCPGGALKMHDEDTGKDIFELKQPIECPPHTEISPGIDAADNYDICKCAKGYAFSRKDEQTKTKVCVPCPPGSYKGSVMDSSCNGLCTQNATSLPGAFSPSQCFCQKGYYYLAGGICAPCVEGARCDGGLVDTGGQAYKRSIVRHNDHVKPVPIEGYYLDKINLELRKPDDWRFIECPIKGACLGEKGCSESMTAYLCAECRTGYTNNFKKGALCSKCPSTLSNVLLTIAWYLTLLLVNIVMACLNVSAGFNRRSIHSVVIKIALNYGVCMSVLNVINFSDLALPEELKSTTIQWIRLLYRETKTYYTSIDCLLQQWFGMKHADAFFYNMLFIACLPVILLFVVTVLMCIILELFKLTRGSTMRSKLALLYQSKVQGMNYLYDRLVEEYANERLFLIFRYIPLPGETRWVRFKHFLEDMIPIYVTVLFSLHGNTTSHMLSLLDCTYINLGQSIPSKYVLRPAMSIKCSLDPDEGYIPYLLLGLGGLIFWGFGIPLFSYIVLLMNRRNLYAPDVRMKYGFLHNGYQQGYWFWEAIVFTRKSLVLVIGSIVIVPSQNTSGSRIWMALAVAVFFLIIQLIYKPFDERDYFVLGRLESHSMISWTASLLAVYLMCYIRLQPTVVTIVCAFLFVNSCYFFCVVITSSVRALLTTLRHKRDRTLFRKLRWIVSVLLYFEARRSLREPQIHYNQRIGQLQLKSCTKRSKWYGLRGPKLTALERYYFVNIVTEIYRIVICHLKLDVMPKLLIEFLIRLSLSFTRLEEKMSKKELFQDLKDGDLSTLVAWAAEKESRKPNRILRWDTDEGGVNIPDMLLNDKNLTEQVGLRREELQEIMDCLFDDNVLEGSTKLPDFYHSITRIWIMDINMLTFLFSVYKHVKYQRDKERLAVMDKSNAKLRAMRNNLQALAEGEKELEEFANAEHVAQMEEQLKRKEAKKERLLEELKEMQTSPDNYTPAEMGGDESNLDEVMRDLGFTVKGALEKYVIGAVSSSESDTDDESDSDSDSEGETTSDSDSSTDEE